MKLTHKEVFECLLNGDTVQPNAENNEVVRCIYLGQDDNIVDAGGNIFEIRVVLLGNPRKLWYKGPENTMNIIEAVAKARKGFKITRKEWDDDRYLKLGNDICLFRDDGLLYRGVTPDLTATDWIIYRDKEQGK